MVIEIEMYVVVQMKLNDKTISELRKIINDDDGINNYRSGPFLVEFFNKLGFNDSYDSGFPTRWKYTEDRLHRINGTPKMEECIKQTFSVIDYLENINILDELIVNFNKYLAFDKYEIKRDNDKIIIKKISEVIIESTNNQEKLFLEKYSEDFDISNLNFDSELENIIKLRIIESKSCLENDNPLSAIFLMGSALEGILFGFSQFFENVYLQEAIKLNKKVKKLEDISLNNLIEISFKQGFLKKDVNQFSHNLRKFRNYIHPNRQLREKFNPDIHSAKICWAVLQATIYQLSKVDVDENRIPEIIYLSSIN